MWYDTFWVYVSVLRRKRVDIWLEEWFAQCNTTLEITICCQKALIIHFASPQMLVGVVKLSHNKCACGGVWVFVSGSGWVCDREWVGFVMTREVWMALSECLMGMTADFQQYHQWSYWMVQASFTVRETGNRIHWGMSGCLLEGAGGGSWRGKDTVLESYQ